MARATLSLRCGHALRSWHPAGVQTACERLGLQYSHEWKPAGALHTDMGAQRRDGLPAAAHADGCARSPGAEDALARARRPTTDKCNLAVALTEGVLDADPTVVLDTAAVMALVAAAYLSSKGVSTVGDWVLEEKSTTFAEDYEEAFLNSLRKRSAFVTAVSAERERLAALDAKAAAGGAGGTGKATAAKGSLLIRAGLVWKWLVGVYPPASGCLRRC